MIDGFGTCEEFKGEVDGYENPQKWVPGFLSNCAATETEFWLDLKCTSLEDCVSVRKMPAYENISKEMRHHARLRWMMKLINLFQEKFPGKFSWVIDGGTVLGIFRHGDIIPHDHDVDIISKTDDINFFIEN